MGIRQLNTTPSNLKEFESTFPRIWSHTPSTVYQHHLESLPRRISAVLNAKVGPIMYSESGHNNLAIQCIKYLEFEVL